VASDKEFMNPFHIMDNYLSRKLDFTQQDALEEYIFFYYFDLIREGVRKNRPVVLSDISYALDQLYIIAKGRNKTRAGSYSKKFMKYLTNIRGALKEQDWEYFAIGS
jgi:hypothetical protein